MAGEHSELLRVLKRDYEAENAEAERHLKIARQMKLLIESLESGDSPSQEQLNQLHSRNGAGARPSTFTLAAVPDGGKSPRKYRRHPEFESMSTPAAIRKILTESGPTHADVLARRIYACENADFQKVKSAVVSETVKLVKQGKLRRTGENVFALAV